MLVNDSGEIESRLAECRKLVTAFVTALIREDIAIADRRANDAVGTSIAVVRSVQWMTDFAARG